jgi:uncharacterized protein YfiM (DUF2279 family)
MIILKIPIFALMNKILPLVILVWLILSGETVRAQVFQTDNPWLQRDKLVHFSWSAGFTPALIQVLEIKKIKHAEIIGASLMFSAGLAKELLVDSHPRYQDVVINLAGCVAGVYLNRLIIKTWNKNHAKKQTRQHNVPPAS